MVYFRLQMQPTTYPTDAAIAARRLRIERIVGTDETRGLRGDLARAQRSKALGHTTDSSGKSIDVVIAGYEHAIANFQARLVSL
jgi:hypothetical protein